MPATVLYLLCFVIVNTVAGLAWVLASKAEFRREKACALSARKGELR
jgi:hypothetical protein